MADITKIPLNRVDGLVDTLAEIAGTKIQPASSTNLGGIYLVYDATTNTLDIRTYLEESGESN